MDWNAYSTEQLLDILSLFEKEGGGLLMEMISVKMQGPINMVLKTEEDADRNRGRVDAFQMLMRLPLDIREELDYRNKKMEESQK